MGRPSLASQKSKSDGSCAGSTFTLNVPGWPGRGPCRARERCEPRFPAVPAAPLLRLKHAHQAVRIAKYSLFLFCETFLGEPPAAAPPSPDPQALWAAARKLKSLPRELHYDWTKNRGKVSTRRRLQFSQDQEGIGGRPREKVMPCSPTHHRHSSHYWNSSSLIFRSTPCVPCLKVRFVGVRKTHPQSTLALKMPIH